jgi:hypothetical protein
MAVVRVRAGSGDAMFRVVMFFFSTHVGRIIAGSVFLISGLAYGFASHSVVYQKAFFSDYSSVLDLPDTSYYLRPNGSGDKYYIFKITDFTPLALDLTTTQMGMLHFTSLTYRSEPQKLDKHYDSGDSVVGTGYQVVEFTLIRSDGSQQQYTTSGYRERPHSFYENDWWGYGAIGVIVGLFFLGISLLVYWLDKHASARALAEGP